MALSAESMRADWRWCSAAVRLSSIGVLAGAGLAFVLARIAGGLLQWRLPTFRRVERPA